MTDRDTRRYMKNMNKLFGGAVASAGKSHQRRAKSHRGTGLSHRQTTRLSAEPVASTRKRQHTHHAGEADKQMIHWKHYHHLFCMMDNLKYQFPALGYERFFSMFTALLTFYFNGDVAGAGSETDNNLTPVSEDRVKWVSSFGIDPAYYGRLTESDLYQRILLPVFGAAYGTFDRATLEKITVNGRRIASCFTCNTLLSRLVKCTRVLFTPSPASAAKAQGDAGRSEETACQQGGNCHRPALIGIDDLGAGEGYHDNPPEAMPFAEQPADFAAGASSTAVNPPLKNSAVKAKNTRLSAIAGSRLSTISQQVKQDAKRYHAHLTALSVHSAQPVWCDCCVYSYRIVLAFDDHDDGINWRGYFRSVTCPAVYVNARVLLSWPLTYDEFVRDFKLAKRTKNGDVKQSRSFLSKTLAIYNMGFYKRIYSVHLWIYFIVMWLWTCQRSVHERRALSADSGVYGTFTANTFPVHLLIQKKLRPMFDDVPSLPLAKLLKTRKVVRQYI